MVRTVRCCLTLVAWPHLASPNSQSVHETTCARISSVLSPLLLLPQGSPTAGHSRNHRPHQHQQVATGQLDEGDEGLPSQQQGGPGRLGVSVGGDGDEEGVDDDGLSYSRRRSCSGSSASSSSSSDGRGSDAEVPASLWLREFDMSRRDGKGSGRGRGGHGGDDGHHGAAAGRGSGSTAAARSGVAHLLKVSQLACLQERPATSFMSTRGGTPTAAGVVTKRQPSPSRSRPGTPSNNR